MASFFPAMSSSSSLLLLLLSSLATIKPSSSWVFTPSYRRKLYHSTTETKDAFCGLVLHTPSPNHHNYYYCGLSSPGSSKVSLSSTSDNDTSFRKQRQPNNNEDDDEDDEEEDGDDNWWNVDKLEVLEEDNFFEPGTEDEAEAWIPDGEMARRKKRTKNAAVPPPYQQRTPLATEQAFQNQKDDNKNKNKPSPYTEEEQELIAAMGGMEPPVKSKRSSSTSKKKDGDSAVASQPQKQQPIRESGFLGDSTLSEIAMDYSVPICYLADVLCIWGVPVPINVHERLGDLITGEQAFALVEAVYSLDVGVLQDRYSNQSMVQVCDDWDIAIAEAFQFAMQNGWSLPFGVQTNLRVEQEEELLRVFSTF